MTPASSKQGMTLIEILIVAGVLAIFSSMVAHAVVLAYRNQAVTSKKTQDFRRAVNSLEWVGRELRMCQKMYAPDPALPAFVSGSPYTPGVTDKPFIFRRFNAATNADIVVGLSYDDQNQRIIRSLYSTSFDLGDATTHTPLETRTLAQNVESFSLSYIDPSTTFGVQMLQVALKINDVNISPNLDVRVKKL
ncbi:MAG: type II secretion system protein J [Vulcanimicrobiota bacterium]